jgi:hemoglobin
MSRPSSRSLLRALRMSLSGAVLIVGNGCATAAARPAPQAPATASRTLYQRVGGIEALAAVTDDFLGRVTADPKLKPFFKGLEEKDMQRIRQHVVDQLCAATGGPCFYPGKDMKLAHEQFEITADIYDTFVAHLGATLDKFKVPDRERNELATIYNSMRTQIVNR